MAGVHHLALLRGINVGGKNLVRMAELRAACEELGLDDVATYIQSGNVVFRAPRRPRAELAARLEAQLGGRFGLDLKLVLLTESELRAVVEAAPPGFGGEEHLSDVIFLRRPLTVARALAAVELREEVDQVWPGKGVLYFSRLAEQAARSRLSKVVMRPEYKSMTIRSWSTTRKLLTLMDSRR